MLEKRISLTNFLIKNTSFLEVVQPSFGEMHFCRSFFIKKTCLFEVLEHSWWETHAFLKVPFSSGNNVSVFAAFHVRFFMTNYNIPWSAAAFLMRNTCHFSRCRFQVKSAVIAGLYLGKELNSITEHHTPWSVAAFFWIFWKIHGAFKMLASLGKCLTVLIEIRYNRNQ